MLFRLFLTVTFATSDLLCQQGPPAAQAELEQRISRLPPEQRTYERFRNWLTMQPVELQRDPKSLELYRAHLRQSGLPANEVDQQIRVVREQGLRLEVERWNTILTAEQPRFNTKPNGFLMTMLNGRKPGTVLDVGMGQGRNAIWLAQQGWEVTGFDPAERAVALAVQNAAKAGVKLTTEVKGSEDFDFGENKWDLIVLSYVSIREAAGKIQRALRPGGIIVLEGMHRDAARGRSIGGGVVFDSGELPALFSQLRVVRYEEPIAVSDYGLQSVRLVRLCAEKPFD